MFESPMLQRIQAETFHKAILAVLKARFGTVPQTVAQPLRAILGEKKLTALATHAAQCSDMEAFREELLS